MMTEKGTSDILTILGASLNFSNICNINRSFPIIEVYFFYELL